MKNICTALSIFFFLVVSTANAQLVDLQNYKKAQAKAELEEKPIILLFTANWCPPCKKLKRELLKDPDFYEVVNKNFVFASIDVDRNRSVADQYMIKGIPDMIFEVKGEIRQRIRGYDRKRKYMQAIDQLSDFKKRRIKRKGDTAKILELDDPKIAVNHWTQLVNDGFHLEAMNLAEGYIRKRGDALDIISYEWLMFYCEQAEFDHKHQFKKRCNEVYDTLNPISIVNFFSQVHQLKWGLSNYGGKEILGTFGGLFGKEIAYRLYHIYAALFMPYENAKKEQQAIIHYSVLKFLDIDFAYQDWEPMVKQRLVNFLLKNNDENFRSSFETRLSKKLAEDADFISGYDVLALLEYQKGNKNKSLQHIAQANEKSVAKGLKFESIIPQLKKQGLLSK